MKHPWLHRYAALTAVATFLLIVAGGLVTSHEAGLSVPDWPLSYGRLMPPMEGGVIWEHSHRLIAATVGLLTAILAIWLWRAERRGRLKWLGLAALVAVGAQGLLGGLTVLMRLPAAISIGHACLAQLFFSATVVIARATGPGWTLPPEPVEDGGRPSLRALALAVPVCVLAQLALGAAARHKVLGIMPHVIGALVVGMVAFFAAISLLTQQPGHAVLEGAARRLLWLTGLQIVLGIAAYLSRILWEGAIRPHPAMVALTVAHVALGALVLAASILLAIEVRRHVRRAEPLLRAAAG